MFTLDNASAQGSPIFSDVVKIKVIGVGGAGGNVVSKMVSDGVTGCEFVIINTDRPALDVAAADVKLQIGEKLTSGRGAGSDPLIGRRSTEESRNSIIKIFEDADLVFITAGMGGGTGTGAVPVIADIARECGVLSIGVVTTPFKFEGARKSRIAADGIDALKSKVDTLVVIPNEKLREVAPKNVSLANAFGIADGVLKQAVINIADLLRSTSYINLDFADLRTILKNAGNAHMGVGEATGSDKIAAASQAATASALMGTSVAGARRILIKVVGSPDITMEDVEQVVGTVQDYAHPDSNIIFGVDFEDDRKDSIRVVVIAADYVDDPARADGSPAAYRQEPEVGTGSAYDYANSAPSSDWGSLLDDLLK
jgi:cell division protein FtsZ